MQVVGLVLILLIMMGNAGLYMALASPELGISLPTDKVKQQAYFTNLIAPGGHIWDNGGDLNQDNLQYTTDPDSSFASADPNTPFSFSGNYFDVFTIIPKIAQFLAFLVVGYAVFLEMAGFPQLIVWFVFLLMSIIQVFILLDLGLRAVGVTRGLGR